MEKARLYRGLLAGLAGLSSACTVSLELYNTRITELDKCRSEFIRAQSDLNATRKSHEDQDRRVDELALERDDLVKRNRQLVEEQERFKDGQGIKDELSALRRVHELSIKRLEALQLLQTRLGPLFSSQTLTVEKPDNRLIVVRINDELLFEPGKADIKTSGVWALRQVAGALKLVTERNFLVSSHTDNVAAPRGSLYRSNWELSGARAVAVVRFFQSEGVDPRRLAAAGYSEFEALGDNETPEGRARNRRVEVVLQPRPEELPPLPSEMPAPDGGSPLFP